MTVVEERDVALLRRDVGEVLTPTDPGFDDARAVWNGAIDRYPSVIARCATASEVAAAIAFARERDIEVSVRGGGHNFAGFAVWDGTLMIDLSLMRNVEVDVDSATATCAGGATWADVDRATQQFSLATPGGFVSHTGVAGLTLGGGVGWLTRHAGLTCDNLVRAEVVTADGQILQTSATEHPDLFWALRGGGGNFGVVTSFTFALHPVGPQVDLGMFFWPADRGTDALSFVAAFTGTLPPEMGALLVGTSAPIAPFVPLEFQGSVGYMLVLVGFRGEAQMAELAQVVRRSMPPAAQLVASMPYATLQQMFDATNQWGALGYQRSVFLTELSPEVIDVFVRNIPKKSAVGSSASCFFVDGPYGSVPDDATAFAGARSTRIVVNISTLCQTPEELETERKWTRDIWAELAPHSSGSGGYINFMAEYDEDRVRSAYGEQKYERLSRIKSQYDPDNVFHINLNIKPMVPGVS